MTGFFIPQGFLTAMRQVCFLLCYFCSLSFLRRHGNGMWIFCRKRRVRIKVGPWTVLSFTMTSRASLKMTSPSPQLKGFMFTAYTLTGPAGIAGAVSLWNPLKRFSSHLCLSFIFTQSTPPQDEIPGCTSARFTRNQGERIWRTLQRLIWKPTRTQITGFFAGWLCCVISSKPTVSYTW